MERPIICSGWKIRKILALPDGAEMQTRRVIKRQPDAPHPSGGWCGSPPSCPYGQPGDRLWIREAFRIDIDFDGLSPSAAQTHCNAHDHGAGARYEADRPTLESASSAWGYGWGRLRSPMHMPRWASRIDIAVTSVRIERLQDITDDDAVAEGVGCWVCGQPYGGHAETDCECFHSTGCDGRASASASFQVLWDEINAKRGHPWNSNPWLWVVGFLRIGP